MESVELLKKQAILKHLTSLPHKVLSLHGVDSISEFVLYDLAAAECFNFNKAAYLVDNPDFDCLKGIAGFDASQYYTQDVIWETPELFIEHMKNVSFNTQVRHVMQPSAHKAGKSDQETATQLGNSLGFSTPSSCSWKMKHDNRGILIYENKNECPVEPEILLYGACLLGFCPIY